MDPVCNLEYMFRGGKNQMKNSIGPAERLLTVSAAVTAVLVTAVPANAESVLVTKVLSAISSVSDSIITILLGLIVLITAISLVRSGLSAQIDTQLQRRFGLSREIIMVLETVTIFVLAMITLPVLKTIMKTAIAKAGSQSVMLGGDFHLPDY